jgi:hypothetical protein
VRLIAIDPSEIRHRLGPVAAFLRAVTMLGATDKVFARATAALSAGADAAIAV